MMQKSHTSMNSSFQSSDNETDVYVSLADNAYYYIAVYLIFLSIAGTFLNGAVILAFVRYKTVQTNANRFVVAICICGLLISTLGIPFAAASAITHQWIFGSFGCKLHGFVLTGLGISMIAIFTAIAVDRYVAVVKFSANWKLKTHEVTAMIALCFTYGGVLALFPLLDWSSYTEEIAKISCSIDWNERSASSISYSITLMFGGLFVPLIIIIALYMQVISLLKIQSTQASYSLRSNLRRVVRRERQVTMTIVIMIVAFIFTWLPYAVFSMVAIAGYESLISPLAQTIPSMFAKSSVLWSPIIFAMRNSAMKNAIFNTFSCLKICCRHHIKHKEKSVSSAKRSEKTTKTSSCSADYMVTATTGL